MIQLNEQQFVLLRHIASLGYLSDHGSSLLGKALIASDEDVNKAFVPTAARWIVDQKIIQQNGLMSYPMDRMNHYNDELSLQKPDCTFIGLRTYHDELLSQQFGGNAEGLRRNSPKSLERWCNRMYHTLLTYDRETKKATDEDDALQVDLNRMTEDLKYTNSILIRMQEDGINEDNTISLWLWSFFRHFPTIRSVRLPMSLIATPGIGPGRIYTERLILKAMSDIQSKQDWSRKVWDDAIVTKWRTELSVQRFLPSMTDWLFEALRFKARKKESSEHGIEMAGPPVVFYSDRIVDEGVLTRLLHHFDAMSNMREPLKDWHPGSNQMVLDLLHPSLYCLVQDRSYVLDALTPTVGMGLDEFNAELLSFFQWYKGEVDFDKARCYDSQDGTLKARSKTLASAPPVPSYSDNFLDFEGSMMHYSRATSPQHTYQWLPTDVRLDAQGRAKLLSYINCLDRRTHADLYEVLTDVVNLCVPLWNECLTRETHEALHNSLHGPLPLDAITGIAQQTPLELFFEPSFEEFMESRGKKDHQSNVPVHYPFAASDQDTHESAVSGADHPEDEEAPVGETTERPEIDWEEEEANREAWIAARKFVVPNVNRFRPPEDMDESDKVRLCNQTIQVIFKMASIELTPEKPRYEGGSWHVEGTHREQIVSTAIYYVDSKNVTVPNLSFRQRMHSSQLTESEMYEQDEHEHMNRLWGHWDDGTENAQKMNIDLGYVTTPSNRLLVFPNSMQHKVSPFELIDKTRPGHRRIVVLFLVDPTRRVTSTAEVSPQFINERVVAEAIGVKNPAQLQQTAPELGPLPAELSQQIMKTYMSDLLQNLDIVKKRKEEQDSRSANEEEEATSWADRRGRQIEREEIQYQESPKVKDEPMTFEEACWHREQLMEQRRDFNERINKAAETDEGWNLCEH